MYRMPQPAYGREGAQLFDMENTARVEDYINEAEEHMNMTDTYKEIPDEVEDVAGEYRNVKQNRFGREYSDS